MRYSLEQLRDELIKHMVPDDAICTYDEENKIYVWETGNFIPTGTPIRNDEGHYTRMTYIFNIKDNALNVFKKQKTRGSRNMKLNEKNWEHFKRGMEGLVYYKYSTPLKLYISEKKASITIDGRKYPDHLALYHYWLNHLSPELVRKIFTRKNDKEWMYKLMPKNSKTMPSGFIAQGLVTKAKSWREYVRLTNPYDFHLSHYQFDNILHYNEMIRDSLSFSNPQQFLKNRKPIFEHKSEFVDYINMCKEIGIQAKFTTNPKRIKDLHDNAVKQYLELQPETFNALNVKECFRNLDIGELIDTEERLRIEGIINRHCVYSYKSGINNGMYAIYSVKYKGEPYTAQVGMSNNKPYLMQLRGHCNKSAPREFEDELKKKLATTKTSSLQSRSIVHEPELPQLCPLQL